MQKRTIHPSSTNDDFRFLATFLVGLVLPNVLGLTPTTGVLHGISTSGAVCRNPTTGSLSTSNF